MSNAFTSLYKDQNNRSLNDYPEKLDKQYLIGLNDSGAWYYNPENYSVHNYILTKAQHADHLELEKTFSMNKEELQESHGTIARFIESDLIDKTPIGRSFTLAKKLADNTHLTKERSLVYAFRVVYDIPREQVGSILDKSKHTVDKQRSEALKDIEKAKAFFNIMQDHGDIASI